MNPNFISVRALCFAIVIAFAAAFACAPAAAEEGKIEYVDVQLEFTDTEVPGVISQRIRTSIQQTGEKALMNKSIEETAQLKDSLVGVMDKIFREVFEGFDIEELSLDVARTSTVKVRLKPREPRVRDLALVIDAPGIHSTWTPVFETIAEKFKESAMPFIKGLPVESKGWAAGVYVDLMMGTPQFHEIYPGFAVTPALEIAETTTVKLTLQAKDPAIRWVSVKVRSRSIPSLTLERLKYSVASETDVFIGLPVPFAVMQSENITKEALRRFNESNEAKMFGLNFQFSIVPAKIAAVAIRVESDRYRAHLKGKVSIGREERDPDIEGHLGVFLFKRFEGFIEVDFFPGPLDLQTNLGVGLRLGRDLYGAVGREVADGIDRAWFEYYITDDVTVAWERGVAEGIEDDSELSMMLQFFDYYSLEVVTDLHHDIWVRIVANL